MNFEEQYSLGGQGNFFFQTHNSNKFYRFSILGMIIMQHSANYYLLQYHRWHYA